MYGFHNYWYWRCRLNHFFNFCDVFRHFHLYGIRNLNFFNYLVWNRYFYSHRNFNSFLFNYFIRNRNLNFHILCFMNNLRRRRRRLNINGLLLLLDLWLDHNLMLNGLVLNGDLLYCLNRLKGSNWLKSCHWLHRSLDYRLCLNRILVLSIVCRSSNISH